LGCWKNQNSNGEERGEKGEGIELLQAGLFGRRSGAPPPLAGEWQQWRGSQRGGGSWRRQRWLPPESPGAMRGPFWFRFWVFVLKQEKDGFKNSERSKTGFE
jgi:hypothetical protein